ncbi:hypothetical protein ALQ71_00463, partial [Pseudomonas coronafaciens pv. striafaciens]
GYNPISDGLWRTVDILIGIALALAFSFALPLYAVFSWRYNLASGLRDCAKVYGRIVQGQPVAADEHLKLTARLNGTMLQLRSLLPSVSKEVKMSMVELDAIQGHFRMCLSTLEILANIRPANLDQVAGESFKTSLDNDYRQIRRQLIGMARALQTGATERLERTSETSLAQPVIPPAELMGYHLMTQQLAQNLDGLQARLAKTARRWKF